MIRIVTFLSIVLISFAIGGSIVASGQVFLAIREIALNTRKADKEEEKEAPNYGMLETIAKLNNAVGWIILIFGVVAAAIISGVWDSTPHW